MDLTKEQILEMTETIARACGLSVGELNFRWDWNDFHHVCDKYGLHVIVLGYHSASNQWLAELWLHGDMWDYKHSDKQTAAFLALHEFAKWKIGEDGN